MVDVNFLDRDKYQCVLICPRKHDVIRLFRCFGPYERSLILFSRGKCQKRKTISDYYTNVIIIMHLIYYHHRHHQYYNI